VRADYVSAADALVVFRQGSGQQRLQIIRSDDLSKLDMTQVECAVSGFKVKEDGRFLKDNRGRSANKATTMGRTIVAISKDGTVLNLFVFKSSTYAELGTKLQGEELHEAINLDNSGSSQMLTPYGVFYAAQGNRPWDKSTPMGRPVPCFFGVLET
jgi:hypothetical protein